MASPFIIYRLLHATHGMSRYLNMQSIIRRILIAIGYIHLSLPLLSPAATLRVPAEHPSIQAAIDASQSGDSILVAPGLYTETLDTSGKSIAIESEEPSDPTRFAIKSPGSKSGAINLRAARPNPSLVGFHISGITPHGPAIYLSGGTVSSCIISDCTAGWEGAALSGYGTITNCLIRNCNGFLWGGLGGALSCSSEGKLSILNTTITQSDRVLAGNNVYANCDFIGCLFYDNSPGDSGWGGPNAMFDIGTGPGANFINCTVSLGSDYRFVASSRPVFIANSIMFSQGQQSGLRGLIYAKSLDSNIFVTTSSYHGSSLVDTLEGVPGGIVISDSVFAKDPEFQNSASSDYELSTLSPCIGRGNPILVQDRILTDRLGAARLTESSLDLGAFQANRLYGTNMLIALPGTSAAASAIRVAPLNSTNLRYRILIAPTALDVNPQSGELTWHPSAVELPAIRTGSVVAFWGGDQSQSITQVLSLVVLNATNSRPAILTKSTDVTFVAGRFGALNLVGSDVDGPLNELTYSMDEGPLGVWVDSASGQVLWVPDASLIGSQTVLRFSVHDNGLPPLSAALSVRVTIISLTEATNGYVSVAHVPDDFQSIQAAVDACLDGGTVVVGPGEYRERIDTLGKGLTITASRIGRQGDYIIRDPIGAPGVIRVRPSKSLARIRGFRVTGVDGRGPAALLEGGIIEDCLFENCVGGSEGAAVAGHGTLERCRFVNCNGFPWGGLGGVLGTSSDGHLKVVNCSFTRADRIVAAARGYADCQFEGCLFYNNYPGDGGWGGANALFSLASGPGISFGNCTFVMDPEYRVVSTSVACQFTNCILYARSGSRPGMGFVVAQDPSHPISLYRCDFYGRELADSASVATALTTSEVVSVDPEFLDLGASRFGLRITSPCIDTGAFKDKSGDPWRDIHGRPRPLGLGPDIGAVEFWPLFSTSVYRIKEGASWQVRLLPLDEGTNTAEYSLISAPDGVQVDSLTGLVSWTPTELHGGAAYVAEVRAVIRGFPDSDVSESVRIIVEEENSAPFLPLQEQSVISERATWEYTLKATDPDIPTNLLTYALSSGPSGVVVDSKSGVVTWTPAEADGGKGYDLVFSVTDNGAPPLSAQATVHVDVRKVNSPPTLAALPSVTIREQDSWNVQLVGEDTDLPVQALTYSLPLAPEGMAVDAITGRTSWTPSEAQGPGVYQVRARVTDSEGLFAEQAFVLTVTEVNQLPEPETVPIQRLVYGQSLALPLYAKDADVPANPLTFHLVSGPAGMSIATNGIASWFPARSQVPSTNIVVASVSDGVVEVPFTFRVEAFDLITSINGQEVTNVLQALPPASVAISSSRTNWLTFFSADGSEPTRSSTPYTGPFTLQQAATVWPIQFSPDFSASVLGIPVRFVALNTQTLAVTGGEGLKFQGEPVEIAASSSSGLPVTIVVVDGPARIESGRLVALGGGTIHLRASQPGNATWASAFLEVTRTIAKASQTISWTTPSTARLADGVVSLTAPASSGLSVAFELLSGPATLNGSFLHLTAAGVVKVRAIQAGDSNFDAASAETSIQVIPLPVVTLQPQSQTVAPGASVSFTIEAQGSSPLSIQWMRNGASIPSATNSTLSLVNVQTANAGLYAAVITDAGGSVTSSAATLKVADLPKITRQPADQDIHAGGSLALAVAATGTGPLAYQWRHNGITSPGGTSATLLIVDATPADAGTYDVIVSSPYGTNASVTAKVTVTIVPPSITSQPQGVSTNAGAHVVLAVVATGVPPISYQWQLWGSPITGATNSTLGFPAIDPADTGTYKVTVFDRYTNAVSLGATIIVNVKPPVITRQPQSISVDAGSSASMSVTATGIDPLTFQWAHDGIPVPGATTSTLSISNAGPADMGGYKVVVRDRYAETTSQGAVLTVRWASPTIVLQPLSQTATEDGEVTLRAAAAGIPTPTLQWKHNGVEMPDQTAESIHLLDLSAADAGNYLLAARNTFGEALSQISTLTVNPAPSLGEALDALQYYFRTGGTAPWQMETTVTHDNTDAAASGLIKDGQSSWLETEVNGPGTFSFWWKASTEAGFDRMYFTVNGSNVTNLTGEVNWRQQTATIPSGRQMLRWEYRKDGSGTGGQDRGWLDQFTYTSTNEQPGVLAFPRFRQRDGLFQMKLVGAPGRIWKFESSSDLQNWDLLGTVTNSGPRMPLIDTNPPARDHRIYRVVPGP